MEKKMLNWEGIVKVQRSVVSTEGTNVLVYNVTKLILYQAPLSDELKEAMGAELRIFCWAKLKNGLLTLYVNERFTEKEFKGIYDD